MLSNGMQMAIWRNIINLISFKNCEPLDYLAHKYLIYEPTMAESWFIHTVKRIRDSFLKDQTQNAQKIALEWAEGLSEKLGLPKTDVWKFFKRALIAKWFGKPENKRFPPGWSVNKALAYANSLSNSSMRFSIFPKDISCHAKSFLLPLDQKHNWKNILAQIDNSNSIEMFPEASTPNTICFRRYTTMFGEEIIYEAGKGQAMYVFEQESGLHPIVSATRSNNCYLFNSKRLSNSSAGVVLEIENKLNQLIQRYDWELSAKCFGLCRSIGIEWISLEGYFNTDAPSSLLVVDLDLPFDFVFMANS